MAAIVPDPPASGHFVLVSIDGQLCWVSVATLRGPQGVPGPRGPMGPAGLAGKPGRDAPTLTLSLSGGTTTGDTGDGGSTPSTPTPEDANVEFVVDEDTGLLRSIVGPPEETNYPIPRTYHVEVGKLGVVDQDQIPIDDLPATPIGNTDAAYIISAACAMSKAPAFDTTFRLYHYTTVGGDETLLGEFTILAGQRSVSMGSIVNEVVPANAFLACAVIAGSNGENLSVVLNLQR